MTGDPDEQGTAPTPLPCSRCGREVGLGRGEGYLVDIRAVADPMPPVFTGDDLTRDASREIQKLLKQLRGMTTRQVSDQVYRRRLFCLCNACYVRWIENPFGV